MRLCGSRGRQRPAAADLAEGARGPVVGRLRTALNEGRGDFAPESDPVRVVDGIYGAHTAAAVRGTQQLGGIQADGVVGPRTWALPVHAAGQVLADISGVPGPGGG
jgi:peptidoglycan hydrolase-like protein with peptidoglycan-binding domain